MRKIKAPKRKTLPSASTETQTDVTLKTRGEIERWIPVFAQVDTQIEEIESQLAKSESWEVPPPAEEAGQAETRERSIDIITQSDDFDYDKWAH